MPTRVMFSRRRSESLRSNADSVAPVDELTSWLGDDVCTTCGSNVQAGQLYCSQQCRDEDAQANVQLYEKASTSAPVSSHRGGKRLSKTSPAADANDLKDDAHKSFRYVCPPSPNILARYGAHLTSPALKALDRRASAKASSANGTAATEMTSASEREWSSSEKSLMTKRRSSSRSTYSSTSEAPSSTPSTPSSPLGRSRAVDELDDLESTDFNLPPSVHSAVYLGGAQTKTLRRSPNQRRIPLPSAVMQPPPPPSATARRESATSMSFARRPSRTSLPAPVLFTSPILATTTMKASSSQRNSSKQRRPSSNGSNGASATPSSWQSRQASHRHEPSNETATTGSSPTSTQQQKRMSIATTIPLGLIRRASTNTQNDQRKASNVSPHSVSASSSAGKTLRAISPSSTAVSFSSEFAAFAAPSTCGRFGCQGLSNSNVNATDRENSSTVTMLSHKHTHSANANLHLLGQKTEAKTPAAAPSTNAAAKLKMTPLLGGHAKLGQEPSDEASAAVQDEREADRTVKSPPRGRSKARGRSSTSRRSPSPPRGIARRGQSEDVAAYMRDYTASTDATEGEASAISPRSNPIRVSRTSRPVEHNVSDADDENDDERSARPRRGRSPTERVGRTARKTPFPVTVTDKAVNGVARTATTKESGGYDDVDLDGI